MIAETKQNGLGRPEIKYIIGKKNQTVNHFLSVRLSNASMSISFCVVMFVSFFFCVFFFTLSLMPASARICFFLVVARNAFERSSIFDLGEIGLCNHCVCDRRTHSTLCVECQ